MTQDIEEDILIKNYLLGNLREEEQLQIEERLFFDREYFQTLQAFEDDLIDDYIYEELSPKEREQFENYFLSTPERHEALRIAKALKSYISINPVPAPSPAVADAQPELSSKPSFFSSLRFGNLSWKLPLAIATLLVIVFALWLLIVAMRTPERTHPLQEAQKSPTPVENLNLPQPEQEQRAGDTNRNIDSQNNSNQFAEQKNSRPSGQEVAGKEKEPSSQRRSGEQIYPTNTQPSETTAPVYVALLAPGGPTRGGGSFNEINPPAGARMITLQLPLVEDSGYSDFQVILSSEDKQVRRTWKGRSITDPKAGKIVSINVPAQLLRQQDYYLKLKGFSPRGGSKEIQTFYFRIAER